MQHETVGHLRGALSLGAWCAVLWFVLMLVRDDDQRESWPLTLAVCVVLGGVLGSVNLVWRVVRAWALSAGREGVFNGVVAIGACLLTGWAAVTVLVDGEFARMDPGSAATARAAASIGALGACGGLVWGVRTILRSRRGRFCTQEGASHG